MKTGIIVNVGLAIILATLVGVTGCKKKASSVGGVPASPLVDTANLQLVSDTEKKERDDFESNIRSTALKSDFDSLESQAKNFRSTKATFKNGFWKLRNFYAAFGHYQDIPNEQTYSNLINQLEFWARERPDSITPRLALAEAYHGYAWQARGAGWASQVSDQAEQLMETRMKKGFEWLKQAWQLQPEAKDPAFYAITLHSFLGANVDRQTYENIFNAGVSNAPDYTPLYECKSYYLLPRWYGEPGESEGFARAISHRNDIPNSAEIFARCEFSLHDLGYFYQEFSYQDDAWEDLKTSFRALESHYPDSLEIKSVYCLICNRLCDYKEARMQLKLLNGQVDLRVWQSKDNFMQMVTWLSQDDAALENQRQAFKANPHKGN